VIWWPFSVVDRIDAPLQADPKSRLGAAMRK
jgi:hypothetical protein